MGVVRGILPSLICWEIWKARCKFRYDKTDIRHDLLIREITSCVQECLRNVILNVDINFSDTISIQLLQQHTVKVLVRKSIVVRWCKPPVGFFKLNTDGSTADNLCGASGIGRNSRGVMVFAFSATLGYGDVRSLCHWFENYESAVLRDLPGYPYELITISCFILSFSRIIVMTCDTYNLSSYMTDEEISKGILFPSISSIRHITMEVGAIAVVRESVVEELAEGHCDIGTKELMQMPEEETKEYVVRSILYLLYHPLVHEK
ncbi:hypothetical protein GIB67_031880 [Kingdonia uniflora]|uniref:Uncharacterized protein n=1 Tax=Kingdonia uniflora TaxID=39325 RepID=A0A7J7LGR5_9MAGN|nr:hypothetical protein GIB67_031880 [Kingdonia uniflora]